MKEAKKRKGTEYPKKGNWILYKEKDVWFRAQVKGKGVKATSKLPYYNVIPEFENDRGINLDGFDWCFVDNPEKTSDKEIYQGESRKKKTPRSGGRQGGNSTGTLYIASPKLKQRQREEVNSYLT